MGKVELRWNKEDGAKSYAETFYVVDASDHFVVLGSTAFPAGSNSADSEVNTLGLNQQTAGMT